jgi:hypothetical protein
MHEFECVMVDHVTQLQDKAVHLMPADRGVLNSNITESFGTSSEALTISLMLLSIFVSSASLAAVTPSFVLKKMLPNAP